MQFLPLEFALVFCVMFETSPDSQIKEVYTKLEILNFTNFYLIPHDKFCGIVFYEAAGDIKAHKNQII